MLMLTWHLIIYHSYIKFSILDSVIIVMLLKWQPSYHRILQTLCYYYYYEKLLNWYHHIKQNLIQFVLDQLNGATNQPTNRQTFTFIIWVRSDTEILKEWYKMYWWTTCLPISTYQFIYLPCTQTKYVLFQ